MTRFLVELAEELCQGKVLFTLEGWYTMKNMLQGIGAVLSELRGAPLANDVAPRSPAVSYQYG